MWQQLLFCCCLESFFDPSTLCPDMRKCRFEWIIWVGFEPRTKEHICNRRSHISHIFFLAQIHVRLRLLRLRRYFSLSGPSRNNNALEMEPIYLPLFNRKKTARYFSFSLLPLALIKMPWQIGGASTRHVRSLSLSLSLSH
jgi:hypothetical protein